MVESEVSGRGCCLYSMDGYPTLLRVQGRSSGGRQLMVTVALPSEEP